MPWVEESVVIHAPVGVVFDLVANHPERMAEWWPTMELQQRVTPPPTAAGSVARYVYNLMGVKINGEHRVEVFMPDERLLVKTMSGIDSAWDFRFEPAEDGTRVTVRVDYALPGSVLGQLLNRVAIEQKNERDLKTSLQNLKRLVETGQNRESV